MASEKGQRAVKGEPEGVIDLFDYIAPELHRTIPCSGPRDDKWKPRIVADWPTPFPVSYEEVNVWETHFADFLDEVF